MVFVRFACVERNCFFEKFAYICDVFDTNIENVFDICKSNRNIFRICIKMIR